MVLYSIQEQFAHEYNSLTKVQHTHIVDFLIEISIIKYIENSVGFNPDDLIQKINCIT